MRRFFNGVSLVVTLTEETWCDVFLSVTQETLGTRKVMPGTYSVKDVLKYDGQQCVAIDDDIAPGQTVVILMIGV